MLSLLFNSLMASATSNVPLPEVNQASSPLAQMHDIALPEKVSSLPIAPGYWILLLLIILSLSWIVKKVLKKYRYHAPRRTALVMLNAMDSNANTFASEVNSLLKRTAMTYLPRQSLAHLNGQPWFNWLDKRIQSLQDISYDEFTAFAMEFLGKENKRRLNVQINGIIPKKNDLHYTNTPTIQRLRALGEFLSKNENICNNEE